MTWLWTSVRFALGWTLLAGLAWPLATASVSGVLFPHQARGSLVIRDGVVVGSALVGQRFASDRYLIGRPSACGYDPLAVAGSNLAVTHPDLRARVAADATAIAARDGVNATEIPPDLVAASGSGIDPDLTLPAARLQLPRIARARGISVDRLEAVLDALSVDSGPLALGTPRVNVLAFNLAIDELR